MLIRTRFWRRKIHTYLRRNIRQSDRINSCFVLSVHIFLADKILRPEMSIVARDFWCKGTYKARRLYATTSRKAPLIGCFRRVRICALWLSNRCSNIVRFRSFLFLCGFAFIKRRRQPYVRFHTSPPEKNERQKLFDLKNR